MVEKKFEDLTEEQKKELWSAFGPKIKEEKKEPTEEKKRPIFQEWLPLGESYGVNISVWDNGVTLQKRKKESGEWTDTEKFTLSKTVLERIFLKIPYWYGLIKSTKED